MFLLLWIAVTIPTLCILWFMKAVVENERLAVKQKLENLYRSQMKEVNALIEEWFEKVRLEMKTAADAKDLALAIKTLVIPNENITKRRLGKGGYFSSPMSICDSFVLLDNEGDMVYPVMPSPPANTPLAYSELWQEAWNAEFVQRDYATAAQLYKGIAAKADHENLAALGLLAQARTLAKMGKKKEALDLLIKDLSYEKYQFARDPDGRLIFPNALLFALEIMDKDHPSFSFEKDRLKSLLTSYDEPLLPSNQRIHLISEFRRMFPEEPQVPNFRMETIALEYVEKDLRGSGSPVFAPTSLPGIWQMATPDKRLTLLFLENEAFSRIREYVTSYLNLTGAEISIVPPGAKPEKDPFLTLPASPSLPNCQIALYLSGADPFSRASWKNELVYLWSGTLVIILFLMSSLFLVRYMRTQLRLTNLKNDFIASVSHELKTPLSSMRLLVDTLLEGGYKNENQVKEYLDILAQENQRLSRLIDNFLSFSRMERRKYSFDFKEVQPGDVVRAAELAVREKFKHPGSVLTVDVAPALPRIMGDFDSLVTVLVNFLDNAYKYTGEEKNVMLSAAAEGDQVIFRVEDNGIGLGRRDIKRIFDRFYQADRTLSRKAGGCGLGLSIVKYIVEAHGGTIEVKSEPGKGSAFTVRLKTYESMNA